MKLEPTLLNKRSPVTRCFLKLYIYTYIVILSVYADLTRYIMIKFRPFALRKNQFRRSAWPHCSHHISKRCYRSGSRRIRV